MLLNGDSNGKGEAVVTTLRPNVQKYHKDSELHSKLWSETFSFCARWHSSQEHWREIDLHHRSYCCCYEPQRSMERFTNTKLANMLLVYVLAEGNARAAAERMYRERYSQKDALDHQVFTNLHHNL
ncbi:hypothetical protein TNCV_2775311 [Trichonephila clavipes]|nr:hypothetical protein TNCV_2775311 [Trichonephila clavipes]